MKNKTLGLIGGIGPESTIEYYRLLIEGFRENSDGEYPSIIINSVNLKRLLAWMAESKLDQVAEYLSLEIERLHRAGADFAALASNTPHIVFDQLRAKSALPLISIVESACERTQSMGLKTVALLGTRYTMQASFYPEVFARAGIRLITPNNEEQTYIHSKYLGELLNNQFLPETKSGILQVVSRLYEQERAEGVILGGTELPLLLTGEQYNGIPLLDTTRIHVNALLRHLLS
jgi:aspartate racemase